MVKFGKHLRANIIEEHKKYLNKSLYLETMLTIKH